MLDSLVDLAFTTNGTQTFSGGGACDWGRPQMPSMLPFYTAYTIPWEGLVLLLADSVPTKFA